MMVRVTVPYGDGFMTFEVEQEALLGVAEARWLRAVADERGEVARALCNPTGCRRLIDLARGAKRVAIAITDHTRLTPIRLILPVVLEELRAAGVCDEDVVVLVATGLHRQPRPEELEQMLGSELAGRLRVVNHDPDDASASAWLGFTSRGTPVEINKLFCDADVRITIGTIEPHHLAGWSGGSKTILPGLASRRAVSANHALCSHGGCGVGVTEGNPVYEDIVEAASHLSPVFMLNVLLDSTGRVVRAFAGEVVAAHRTAVDECSQLLSVPVPGPADILVVSPGGAPRDRDFWQVEGKALTRAKPLVRHGGVVVLLAQCSDGIGNAAWAQLLRSCTSKQALESFPHGAFTTLKNKTYRLAALLEHAHLIVVTRHLSREDFPGFPITFCSDVQHALDLARGRLGGQAKMLVVPRSASVLLAPVAQS
jgi:LSD1 subclass zinc finger protein